MKNLLKLMLIIFLMTGYTAFAQTQTFTTVGTNSWVAPAGVTSITVECWGAGGAGGGVTSGSVGAGGGGGGAYAKTIGVAVTPGTSYTLNVGDGGNGGTGNGAAGTASSFNTSVVVALGGAGGIANSGGAGGLGATAAASTGAVKTSGGNGAAGSGGNSGGGGGGGGTTNSGGNASGTTAGSGGATGGGAGGAGLTGSGNGNDGNTSGGGGSGGRRSFSNRSGGDGANGKVIITWTCAGYTLASTAVTTPICIGGTTTVTLTGGTLPDGSYTVTYNRSAPNAATGVTASMTVASGVGSFATAALANAGATTITITNISSGATGGTCSSAISSGGVAIVTVNALATAAAGTSVTTCSNAGAVNITLGSGATNNSGVLWTSSGTGTWTNDNSLTLAEYTPSGADITAGVVTLTLTSLGNAPCGNATSNKTLTINPAPTVTPANFCQGGSASLTASATCPTGTATATGSNSSTFTLNNTSPVHNINMAVSGVPAGAVVTDVNVSVTIAHNYQSDVVLSLRAADGTTTVSLTGASGAGNSNNLGNTTSTITDASTGAVVTYTFDQAASTQAWGSSNPATAGSFRPASAGGNMNTFNGLTTAAINGNWTLIADDDANNDHGLITAVSISIQYTYPGAISWYTVPTGGNVVQTGSPFNPVGDAEVLAEGGIYANLANSNTPGTYTFYTACSSTSTCREAVTFVIDQAVTVNAGADVALCNPTSYTLAGSFGGSATSAMWSSTGDGSFDDAGSMGAIYTFGTNDLLGGVINLTLTTNDPAGVCGALSDNMNIAVRTTIASNPVSGSGPSSVCPPSLNHTLTVTPVANADYYSWAMAPTTNGITFNGATNGTSVNVDYGTTSNSSYSIRVHAINACGTSVGYVSVFTRRAVGAPANPTGATVACANDVKPYTIPAVTGAETYTWSGPAGSLIDGNPTPYTAAGLTSVNVTFPAGFTSGQVGVAANVACFTSTTKNINVSVATVTTGIITGSTYTVCPGSSYTYSVVPIANAVSYNWVLPANMTGSSSSNSIVVTPQVGFSSANIKVAAVSVCGVASAQQQKTLSTGVAARPASVTGPTNGMCGQTVVNTCPSQAGVTYNWTVPPTATINSGNGSNAVSVTYGTFASGAVCVTATNACGTSPSRCITVNGAPATPAAITAIPGSWCANTSGVEFDANVSNITGSYTLSWIYPSAAICTYVLGGGNSSSLIVDWISGSGNVIVTASNACGNGSRIFNAGNSCREDVSENMEAVSTLSVSPNPAHNVININFTSALSGMAKLAVTDLSGRTLVNTVADVQNGNNTTRLNVSHLAKGIYMVMVQNNGEVKQSRIVIE